MRKAAFCLPWTGVLLLLLFGCSDPVQSPDPSPVPSQTQSPSSIGELHNEFLRLVEDISAEPQSRILPVDAPFLAARKMASRYDVPPLSASEVHASVQRGGELAQQDPVELVRGVLSAAEYEWWDRFASEATPATARAVRADHERRFGKPPSGSPLESLLDVAVASAEYWYARRLDATPIYKNPYVGPLQKGWRDRFRKWGRFAVAVAVDGVSGTVAAEGGGPVVGAIVGGLASHGADCLLYGCN